MGRGYYVRFNFANFIVCEKTLACECSTINDLVWVSNCIVLCILVVTNDLGILMKKETSTRVSIGRVRGIVYDTLKIS